MTPWEAVAVFGAGVGAGAVNTVVGSGTLITFPVLLATGLAPVTATVSNALGLVPGSVSGAIGFRRELRGQRRRLVRLAAGAVVGGLTGATLLLTLPPAAFELIVPVLIGIAVLLVAFRPRIARLVARRRRAVAVRADGGRPLVAGITLASVYGGYFAAAQGIVYLSLMGVLLDDSPARLNAAKNVLTAVVNGVAAAFFLFTARFDWVAVALIAVGSALGGQVGARVGRRISPGVLRLVVVVVGTAAIVQLVARRF